MINVDFNSMIRDAPNKFTRSVLGKSQVSEFRPRSEMNSADELNVGW
jgi:hypothetical protein